MTTISILEAVNTSAVQFHGQPIITAMVTGVAYIAMRPIVENIGIDWTGQSVKLRSQKENSTVEISLWLLLTESYASCSASLCENLTAGSSALIQNEFALISRTSLFSIRKSASAFCMSTGIRVK